MVRIYPLLGQPQDYVSDTELNDSYSENENENGTSPRRSRKKGSAEDCEFL
jgi:hypothetical protein